MLSLSEFRARNAKRNEAKLATARQEDGTYIFHLEVVRDGDVLRARSPELLFGFGILGAEVIPFAHLEDSVVYSLSKDFNLHGNIYFGAEGSSVEWDAKTVGFGMLPAPDYTIHVYPGDRINPNAKTDAEPPQKGVCYLARPAPF